MEQKKRVVSVSQVAEFVSEARTAFSKIEDSLAEKPFEKKVAELEKLISAENGGQKDFSKVPDTVLSAKAAKLFEELQGEFV